MARVPGPGGCVPAAGSGGSSAPGSVPHAPAPGCRFGCAGLLAVEPAVVKADLRCLVFVASDDHLRRRAVRVVAVHRGILGLICPAPGELGCGEPWPIDMVSEIEGDAFGVHAECDGDDPVVRLAMLVMATGKLLRSIVAETASCEPGLGPARARPFCPVLPCHQGNRLIASRMRASAFRTAMSLSEDRQLGCRTMMFLPGTP
jgi:hypothetical protein